MRGTKNEREECLCDKRAKRSRKRQTGSGGKKESTGKKLSTWPY